MIYIAVMMLTISSNARKIINCINILTDIANVIICSVITGICFFLAKYCLFYGQRASFNVT